MNRALVLIVSAVAAASWAPRVAAAQDQAASGYATYARTTQSHQNAWGGGAQYQLTWGEQNAPIRLGTSLGGDYQKTESSGSSQTSVSLDATLQPGGGSVLTPYVGGSVSANWLSGTGMPSGSQPGFQYILGLQYKPEAQGPLAIQAEVRPGYVRTQEHQVTGRVGVLFSL